MHFRNFVAQQSHQESSFRQVNTILLQNIHYCPSLAILSLLVQYPSIESIVRHVPLSSTSIFCKYLSTTVIYVMFMWLNTPTQTALYIYIVGHYFDDGRRCGGCDTLVRSSMRRVYGQCPMYQVLILHISTEDEGI